jgi:hypothetical protein
MEAGKFSFKFSRQTQKNLVGSSKYAYFSQNSPEHMLSLAHVLWGILERISSIFLYARATYTFTTKLVEEPTSH